MPRISNGCSRKFTSRKRKFTTEPINRILNVYKPVGISSYDVVRRVKHILEIKKVGHGGTLDPFAEGVLLILIGKATKQMLELLKLPKSYEAILYLGEATASGDNTTPVIRTAAVPTILPDLLKVVAKHFTGTIEQIPPAFSAKKINGRPAYRYVRKGLPVELKPNIVNIYALDLKLIEPNAIMMNVTCSSGTYIRTLGENIAKRLGTEGHLKVLKRIRIGDYDTRNALQFSEIDNLTMESMDSIS